MMQRVRNIRVYPRSYPRISASTNTGFTYIELLITLAIMAILFVPIMQLFSYVVSSSALSRDIITATNLAKWEMERTKNLNVTKAQLIKRGDSVYPAFDKEPLAINDAKWRIKREIIKGTDPLEVRVHVYHDLQIDEPVVTLVTLIEDMFWEEIRPVK